MRQIGTYFPSCLGVPCLDGSFVFSGFIGDVVIVVIIQLLKPLPPWAPCTVETPSPSWCSMREHENPRLPLSIMDAPDRRTTGSQAPRQKGCQPLGVYVLGKQDAFDF